MPPEFQIVNKTRSMPRFFVVSSSGGKRLHSPTLKATAGNCSLMSSLGQIKPLCKVIELNSSQDFSLAKLKPIKTATNEDSLSFLLALLSEENGAIKKAFYLSAIKEPTIASGRFPPKAGEQSCRWAMSLMGWAAEDAGAGEGGLQVHGLMPSWAQPEGRCFWGNGPISTHKTRQLPQKNT